MEPELKAALDQLGTAIAGVETRLTARIDRVELEVCRVETQVRTLIEQDVVPKIEQVAEAVAAAREQAERRLTEELGAFGPRTVAGEVVLADMLHRIQRLERRRP